MMAECVKELVCNYFSRPSGGQELSDVVSLVFFLLFSRSSALRKELCFYPSQGTFPALTSCGSSSLPVEHLESALCIGPRSVPFLAARFRSTHRILASPRRHIHRILKTA
jgi:hypothetical protein